MTSPVGTISQQAVALAKSYPPIVGNIGKTPTPPSVVQQAAVPIAANGQFPFVAAGDFVFIQSITPAGSIITVGPLGRPGVPVTANKRFIRFKDGYENLQIVNQSANAVIVNIVTGFGEYREDGLDATTVATVPTGGLDNPGNIAEFTRPNNVTPYTIGDHIGDGAAGGNLGFTNLARTDTAGNIVNGVVRLRRLRLAKSSIVTLDTAMRLWLFNAVPAVVADNLPFTLLYAARANLVAMIDIPTMLTEGAGSGCFAFVDLDKVVNVNNSNGGLYGILTARGPYVPTAFETFSADLLCEQF